MAFSMHSHSGQFCPGHAKDSLEEIVLRAISLKMHLLALTEHMPRDNDQDLYPEEIAEGGTIAELLPRHAAYITEALRLRAKYSPQISLLIGFEGEWIRPSSATTISSLLLQHPGPDFFIGSVHHVHTIPIDFDRATYERAREASSGGSSGGGGGTDEALFEDYYDAQFDMLGAVRPPVIGHLDLIRLFSDEPDADPRLMRAGVWRRVERNLKRVVEQGALVEVNSSALRKGLREPYPGRRICEAFLAMGGKLTLSDDSHGVAQVGLNYGRVSAYLQSLGVTELYHPERQDEQGYPQTHHPRPPLLVKKLPFTGLDGAAAADFPSTTPPLA